MKKIVKGCILVIGIYVCFSVLLTVIDISDNKTWFNAFALIMSYLTYRFFTGWGKCNVEK